MNKTVTRFGIILLLCVPLATPAQDKDPYRANREQATQIAAKVERTINAKERKWKLKDGSPGDFGFDQYWKSGKLEVRISISLYDSPDAASKILHTQSMISSVAGSETLLGFGDEAYYISHRYFGTVGVRKGSAYAEVYAPSLALAKRFAQYALEQLEAQSQ